MCLQSQKPPALVSSHTLTPSLTTQDEDGTTIGAGLITLPGQKYPTPSPGNGDRVFYETLLESNPESLMAQEWCVFYGVLDAERATKLLAVILKRKGLSSLPMSPVKAAASSSSSSSSGGGRSKIGKDAEKKKAVAKADKAKGTPGKKDKAAPAKGKKDKETDKPAATKGKKSAAKAAKKGKQDEEGEEEEEDEEE